MEYVGSTFELRLPLGLGPELPNVVLAAEVTVSYHAEESTLNYTHMLCHDLNQELNLCCRDNILIKQAHDAAVLARGSIYSSIMKLGPKRPSVSDSMLVLYTELLGYKQLELSSLAGSPLYLYVMFLGPRLEALTLHCGL